MRIRSEKQKNWCPANPEKVSKTTDLLGCIIDIGGKIYLTATANAGTALGLKAIAVKAKLTDC